MLSIKSIVPSLNFSMKSTSSSGSTSLSKHDWTSASLRLSISIPLTHSVLNDFPKNLFTASFCKECVFPHPVFPMTNIFPLNWAS